ncbi:exodeoxyribonuclease VII small subunit [Marinicella sp. W31]|uniref:exodeoxyribonuclease VII small subunit n=1 Tax=Marinicella sp. W31 TaxID=3023713 RepID=UPI003756D831
MTAKKNFEQSVAQLETIVKQMESQELGLEESLKLYEQGVKLTKECQRMLSSAEQKIQKLMQETEGDD